MRLLKIRLQKLVLFPSGLYLKTPQKVRQFSSFVSANQELQPIQSQLAAYNQKAQAGTLSEADRAQANLLQLDYSQKIQDYQAKFDAAYSSFSQLIDPLIAQTAKDQGFSVVMNSEIAASSGLVILC